MTDRTHNDKIEKCYEREAAKCSSGLITDSSLADMRKLHTDGNAKDDVMRQFPQPIIWIHKTPEQNVNPTPFAKPHREPYVDLDKNSSAR